MAGRENRLKKYLVQIMGTRWHVQSHEDKYTDGIPDLSYGAMGVSGWIELKQAREWPSRGSTPLRFTRFTAQQVNWLRKRGKAAGFCWVLAKIDTEYFLFPFHEARTLATGMTESQYRTRCFQYWKGSIDPAELLAALTS